MLVAGGVAQGGCGRLGFDASGRDGSVDDGRSNDAVPDAPFGNVRVIAELDNLSSQDDPTLTSDELELMFTSFRPGGLGDCDLWSTTRAAITDPWRPPVNLGPTLNTAGCDSSPELAGDGLTLWFASTQTGDTALYEAHRSARDSAWQAPAKLAALDSTTFDLGPTVTGDQRTLMFYSSRTGNFDLYVSTRALVTDPWPAPTPVSELNTPSFEERSPFLSADAATLWYVSSARGNQDIYISRRQPNGRFGAPSLVSELSSATKDDDPWVSPDQRRIYFARDVVGQPNTSELMIADR